MSSTIQHEPGAAPTRRPSGLRRRRLAIAASTVAIGLLGAGSAQAATIDYDQASGTMTVIGTAGDEDLLLQHEVDPWGVDPPNPNVVEVTGITGSPLTAAATAAGCANGGWEEAWTCPRPNRIVVDLGAGDDNLKVIESTLPFAVALEIDGGAGNDSLGGGSENDVIRGGDGDDLLSGGPGDDQIYGGAGNDRLAGDASVVAPGGNDYLDGGEGDDIFEEVTENLDVPSLAGSDTYVGGPGNDSFSYFFRSEPVSITLDGVANDGMAGEADNIHPDIETVGGGGGNDVIVGSPGPDHLWGGGGDDVIRGLGGNDQLWGNNGSDTIDGGDGDDELIGGCMADTLIGGPGADTFNSDGTACSALLRSAHDRFEAADGERDAVIFCQLLGDGPGDTAIVDAIDPVVSSGPGACATITVVGAPGNGGSNPPDGSGGTSAPRETKRAEKDKTRAKLGKTVTLLTGTGKKGAAAKMALDLKRKRLTLGTLRATKKTKITTTATIRRRGRKVTLGRTTVTVNARRMKVLRVRLSARAVRALKGMKKAKVSATFKIKKTTYRNAFTVRVPRR